ncbi:hypothetical protein M3J09_007496 [Ascochyta lentis]
MKVPSLLVALVIGPSIANAWLCFCQDKTKPSSRLTLGLCSGSSLCGLREGNACILDHPITSEQCAGRFPKAVKGKIVPNPNVVSHCEHYVGPCPTQNSVP